MATIERATVTRVVSGGRQVFVEVPKLGLGQEFGPCDVLRATQTLSALDGTAEAHTHQMPPLTAGMKVIVAAIHDVPDDLVVLGIIA